MQEGPGVTLKGTDLASVHAVYAFKSVVNKESFLSLLLSLLEL